MVIGGGVVLERDGGGLRVREAEDLDNDGLRC